MRTTRMKRTNTDLKFKFVLANPMTGKVKKSVFHPSSFLPAQKKKMLLNKRCCLNWFKRKR